MDKAETIAALETSLLRRGLLTMGVDGHGNPARWESPYLIDVRFTPPDRMYYYELEAVVRPLVGPIGAEDLDELKAEVIAGGRRHAMAGNLES